MKTLGLIAAMFLGLAGLPAAASANGWRGGHGGGHGRHVGHGYRGAPVVRVHAPAIHVGVGIGARHAAPVRAHVWVPGYWAYRGGTRLWIGGGYYVPPTPGWVWVAPQWVWTGYQWSWQEGHWAPPA